VKAAYLFNFTKYVEWPPEAFPDASASIVLGVLGRDPFQGAVDEVIRGRMAGGRSLGWKVFREAPPAGACQVLFIGDNELRQRGDFLRELQQRPILTVGESEAFGRAGGIIWFVMEEQTVRVVINLDAARRARLTISSKLLGVARVVGDKDFGAVP